MQQCRCFAVQSGIRVRTEDGGGGNGACVQVAPAPDRVLVRDSKDPHGPALTVPTPAWQVFLTTLRRGPVP